MKLGDKELGMDRAISRRDFLNGTAVIIAAALAGGGFDPAEDIAAITVNRWGHGYSYRYRPRWDSGYDGNEVPHVVGRRRLGRISIANSDAGASAIIEAAIDEAHRAIAEIDSNRS